MRRTILHRRRRGLRQLCAILRRFRPGTDWYRDGPGQGSTGLRNHRHRCRRRIARRLRHRRCLGSQAVVSVGSILGLRGAIRRFRRMAHLRSGCRCRHPEGHPRWVFFVDRRSVFLRRRGVASFARVHQAFQQRGELRLRSSARCYGVSRRSRRNRAARESERRRLASRERCLWSERLHAVSIADRRPNGPRTFCNRLPRPNVARDCHAVCPRQETAVPQGFPATAHRPPCTHFERFTPLTLLGPWLALSSPLWIP